MYSILFLTIYSACLYCNEFRLLLYLLRPASLVECIGTIILPSVNRFLAHAFYVFQKAYSLSSKAVDFADLKTVKLLSGHQACQTKTIRLRNIFLSGLINPDVFKFYWWCKTVLLVKLKKAVFCQTFSGPQIKNCILWRYCGLFILATEFYYFGTLLIWLEPTSHHS